MNSNQNAFISKGRPDRATVEQTFWIEEATNQQGNSYALVSGNLSFIRTQPS